MQAQYNPYQSLSREDLIAIHIDRCSINCSNLASFRRHVQFLEALSWVELKKPTMRRHLDELKATNPSTIPAGKTREEWAAECALERFRILVDLQYESKNFKKKLVDFDQEM